MSAYSVQSGDYILYPTSAIPQQHTVYSRTVSASVLAAGSTLVAAAPAQAVLELSSVERLPTPATVQTSNATLAASDRDESNIRVLTFNCWGLRFVSQHRLARVTAIADRILNASPAYDVVALQELWLKSDHALIAEAVAPVLPYSTVFYSGAFGSGLSLFSRYPIEQAQMHPFALAGDPIDVLGGDWFVGKGVAAATLAHPVLGHVELLTSHMFARGGETGTVLQQAHRLIGAWEYSQLIRRAAELGRYVIVAGDFNAVDGSAPLEFIRAHAKVQDAWWETHNLTSPAVPIVFPIPKEGAATSALAAIHQHGVTADSPLNSWSAGKPLDATARRHLGKRLDYVLYRGPDARAEFELVASEAKVVMTERMADLGVSLSDHFGVEVVLGITPAGVSTQPERPEFAETKAEANATEILPPLPIPPPVARTRALVLHDTLHVLHAAIPASYAASTAYLTTGIACAFSLVALAVAAGAVGWGPNAKRHRPRVERSNTDNTSPVRAERKRTRAYTTPSPTHPTDPQSPQTPLSSPPPSSPPPALRLPFLPSSSPSTKSRPIQAPWWLGIVLVLAGGLLAAAGTTLLYAGVLFGRWERNAIWDVIDQMERLSSRGGIGQ
ncbi:DNase I-like protein, partial [Rhizoctonia solani]